MFKGGFYLVEICYKYNNMICYIVIVKVNYLEKKFVFNFNLINKW